MSSSTSPTSNSPPPSHSVYSHDTDCEFEHPIPDADTLDNIINSVIDSYSSPNSSISRITREFIENTIHEPLHSLLIPSHKCKSPFVFHQHLNARTLFKLDYINIIHKEILSPKQKLTSNPTPPSCTTPSSSRPGSRNKNNYPYSTSPSPSTSSPKTLDQEINILASIWGDSSPDVKQVYEVLEKCSKIVHEYMFVANRMEKEREEAMNRIENAEIYQSSSNPQQQRIITKTDPIIDGIISGISHESKDVQEKSK